MKKTIELGSGKFRVRAGVIAQSDIQDALIGKGRGNVVMVRLGDEALARVDQLVEATMFGSRSECAAFLIGAGIQSHKQLFERLGEYTAEMRKLKEQLRQVALESLQPPPAEPPQR